MRINVEDGGQATKVSRSLDTYRYLVGQVTLSDSATLEASEMRAKSRKMDSIKQFTRDMYGWINSFVIQIRKLLHWDQVPDLSRMHEEGAPLRLEVCTLAESHPSFIPLIIPFIS